MCVFVFVVVFAAVATVDVVGVDVADVVVICRGCLVVVFV